MKCHEVFFDSKEVCSFCLLKEQKKSFKELFEKRSQIKQEISLLPKHAFRGDTKILAHKQYFIQTFGNQYFLVELLADITEERAKEELYLRNRKLISLGTMMQTLIHNLKNPLLGMQLTIENLKKKIKVSNVIYSRIRLLKKDLQKASSLISEITNFVKRKSHPLEPVNIKTIIEESYDYVSSIQLFSLHLHWSWHCGEDILIPGNTSQLKLLFENLFENSIYAFKKNKVKKPNIWIQSSFIEHSTKKIKETTNSLRLKIIDNAGGIHKNIIRDIFDPFFTTKASSKNNGMGLAIVNKVVAEHFGKIEVYSVHEYTEFIIYFPMEYRIKK